MRQLLYASRVSADLSASALNDILLTARANNALCGVTGLLLHIDGGFLQLLEGDERTVRELYNQISRDRRHQGAHLMLDRAAPRVFEGWSMGFEWPTPDDPEQAGMYAVTRQAVDGLLAPGAGRIVALMLETFYRVQHQENEGGIGLAAGSLR